LYEKIIGVGFLPSEAKKVFFLPLKDGISSEDLKKLGDRLLLLKTLFESEDVLKICFDFQQIAKFLLSVDSSGIRSSVVALLESS
jgi:hypothetical protein